jgi:hypothetical protein
MKKYDALRKQLNDAASGAKTALGNLNTVADEAGRISRVARDAHIIIEDIDKQFEEKTKLTKVDIGFLFFAVALQVARQYFFTNFKERTGHNEAAKDAKQIERTILGKETKSDGTDRKNSTHSWYRPSLPEVMFNPVPFDQTTGLEGLGGAFEHRAKTPGHDAILGYIFGTVNIATSTLTTWTMQSFHIKYGDVGSILKPMGTNNANTVLVFDHTIKRLTDEGVEGKIIMAVSLFREVMHLKSDINSKVSIPIPIVSSISPEFAKQIAGYGLDIANIKTIGKQAVYAALINTLIAMLHRLLYDETKSGSLSLYEVRTRKILSYSNVIASASNLIAVALVAAIGLKAGNEKLVKKSLEYLDIGGLLVTLYRIVTDYQFIKKIKQEFLEKEFYNRVYGAEYDF